MIDTKKSTIISHIYHNPRSLKMNLVCTWKRPMILVVDKINLQDINNPCFMHLSKSLFLISFCSTKVKLCTHLNNFHAPLFFFLFSFFKAYMSNHEHKVMDSSCLDEFELENLEVRCTPLDLYAFLASQEPNYID